MGARSITHIHQMDSLGENIVCSFYRHFDGYIEGHGKDLAEWLSGKRLVNGIGADFKEGIDFNRAGTMAVNLMMDIQNISGCEVIPTGSKGIGEEYEYHILFRDDEFYLLCKDVYEEREVLVKVKDFDPEKVAENLDNPEE